MIFALTVIALVTLLIHAIFFSLLRGRLKSIREELESLENRFGNHGEFCNDLEQSIQDQGTKQVLMNADLSEYKSKVDALVIRAGFKS